MLLRMELAQPGISVSLIQPGLIRSPMSEAVKADVDHLLSQMSQQDVEDYAKFVQKISTLSDEATAPPDAVIKAAIHIFTAKRPRSRYRAGVDAKAVAIIRHFSRFNKKTSCSAKFTVSRRKVIVIGAGLGGLTAAYRLQAAGLDVQVLEANTFPGGRVRTVHREGFIMDVGARRDRL